MASIRILSGTNAGEKHALKDRETLVGRHPECQVVLRDSTVSRRHARISQEPDGFFLDDLGSQHGTRVNGEVVRSRCQLHDADEIELSQVKLSFVADGSSGGSSDRPSTIVATVDLLQTDVQQDSREAGRWRALLEITRTLGVSLDLRHVLPDVLDSTFTILPQASRGCILLQEEGSDLRQPYAVKDIASPQGAPPPPPISNTIIDAVMREGKAILSNDAGEDERFEASESVLNLQFRSILCAPLIGTATAPIGMIQLDAQDPTRQFTADDLDVLVNIANLVGQAVDHSRLHKTQLQYEVRERDMETARQVQQHFLPRETPEIAGYQLANFYSPADAVGGDYFGYTPLPSGQYAVSVGDVAGHGVPAAMLMARLCSEARYCLVTDAVPSDAVQRLNEELTRHSFSFFITFAICVLDPVKHEVTIVNAGHMPPLVRRDASGEVHQLAGGIASPPLGIDSAIRFRQQTFPLEPGDIILMYTDGISEMPNPSRARYGGDRVSRLLAAATDAQHAVTTLLADVRKFAEGGDQEDDICVVAFCRKQ